MEKFWKELLLWIGLKNETQAEQVLNYKTWIPESYTITLNGHRQGQ